MKYELANMALGLLGVLVFAYLFLTTKDNSYIYYAFGALGYAVVYFLLFIVSISKKRNISSII
ncbi:hypothetical protein IPA_03395 [Ignicoccus pacificus DSM 13166]|uniref:Uncharacterized protein n=1 Tax=Ignicoccus pacificus DSM 13166 TaxID=940294 RepID=A0A977KAX6_9CREN|nr:hypothetical protein IPA_03395 [Ignicoccus pacificus DSM 13166]